MSAENPLQAALSQAIAHYRERNPGSEAQLNKAAEVLPGGNTRSVLFHAPFPLTMVRGEGCHLWDVDGHAYLDAIGEFSAAIYGHSHPVIREAIAEALDGGLSLSSHTVREALLAEEIRRRFPSMQQLRFTNSGTEANLLALAAATAHTGRRKVMVFEGAYHGGVLSFAGGHSAVNVPHDYVIARYNDLEGVRELVRDCGQALAAILVEPMLGASGCIPANPDFLQGLRELSAQCGALLIFDEVMTSRLSTGGRQALLGIQPDLTTVGKYLGGGMSFGAFGGQEAVMRRFDPRQPDALSHAGTFNNNVLTMSAGLAGLTKVLTPQAQQALNDRGDRLRQRLNGVFAKHKVAAQFTGLGSLMTLHTTQDQIQSPADLAQVDPRQKELMYFDLLERGIFMARRGFMTLSLPFGDPQADELVAALEDVVIHRHALLPPAQN